RVSPLPSRSGAARSTHGRVDGSASGRACVRSNAQPHDASVDPFRRTGENRAAEVPVPRIAAFAGAWILEGVKLKPALRHADRASVLEERFTIRRNEMRHAPAVPHVTVQPETSVHGIDHPVFSFGVFA